MKNSTQIRAYIRMLLERFEFDNNKKFTPPQGVVNSAKSALNIISRNDLTASREDSEGKHEGSGKRKAQELVNKTPQTHEQIKRLSAFFNANRETVMAEKNSGKTIQNSPHIQSWELHGGDSGDQWTAQCLSQTKHGNLQTKKHLRFLGGASDKKGLGTMSPNLMSTKSKNI